MTSPIPRLAHQEESDPSRLDNDLWKCNTPRYESCQSLRENEDAILVSQRSMTFRVVRTVFQLLRYMVLVARTAYFATSYPKYDLG